MASGTLSIERLHEAMALDDPESISTGTSWAAWLLAHGFTVESEQMKALGFSQAITHLTISTLTRAGYAIERTKGDGRGNPYRYRVTARPDGTKVRAKSDDERPPVPLALATHERTNGNATTKARKAVAKAADKAAKGKELAVIEPPDEPIPPKRLALLRPSMVAPALGTPMRVVMVGENKSGATMALRDEHGRTWFAHLDEDHHG